MGFACETIEARPGVTIEILSYGDGEVGVEFIEKDGYMGLDEMVEVYFNKDLWLTFRKEMDRRFGLEGEDV